MRGHKPGNAGSLWKLEMARMDSLLAAPGCSPEIHLGCLQIPELPTPGAQPIPGMHELRSFLPHRKAPERRVRPSGVGAPGSAGARSVAVQVHQRCSINASEFIVNGSLRPAGGVRHRRLGALGRGERRTPLHPAGLHPGFGLERPPPAGGTPRPGQPGADAPRSAFPRTPREGPGPRAAPRAPACGAGSGQAAAREVPTSSSRRRVPGARSRPGGSFVPAGSAGPGRGRDGGPEAAGGARSASPGGRPTWAPGAGSAPALGPGAVPPPPRVPTGLRVRRERGAPACEGGGGTEGGRRAGGGGAEGGRRAGGGGTAGGDCARGGEGGRARRGSSPLRAPGRGGVPGSGHRRAPTPTPTPTPDGPRRLPFLRRPGPRPSRRPQPRARAVPRAVVVRAPRHRPGPTRASSPAPRPGASGVRDGPAGVLSTPQGRHVCGSTRPGRDPGGHWNGVQAAISRPVPGTQAWCPASVLEHMQRVRLALGH
ncbi:collagen alpha-1(I) chain-like [Dipodomys spectabilis]|uniref:collagen alpha-1(I) chain-like n=1 Tax=Dipodomys spectabilis TaxID=105255 RepID=UPI001C549A14|nr:collagen alpha-1(I) chain-like [Dipodomys spectabilis]